MAPGQKWIINFQTNIFDIIGKFEHKECKINFTFSQPSKKWIYKGKNSIKFDEYSHFTLYISEVDEINDTLKKINTTLKKVSDNNDTSISEDKICTEISNLKDEVVKQIINIESKMK